ncbi:hypothetical protein PENCOP_c015G06460 [Penicillium coprophilum]|uniref:ER-bound oxygenase mpaB/mpaB'/Rubber oxygenase catalytic domain-containing protein n=1 Tax=Penicillium coprophilum TaxID=36646 RepID=A0A1V6UAB5_9EURO|nr:hypothetical protein PENCOP_c015G06460 [Penicillium coprophilum]
MTLEGAFEIQLRLAELELPTIFSISISFALLKTYGIPSISKLLVATGELSNPEFSFKSAADTGVLVTGIVLNKARSDWNMDAITRMDWLHDRYRTPGEIKDEDKLYTLSLFVLEPVRWTERFEWLERCALAIYWKNLGEVMDIQYDALPSAKSGWQDEFHWLDKLKAWSKAYDFKSTTKRHVSNATSPKAGPANPSGSVSQGAPELKNGGLPFSSTWYTSPLEDPRVYRMKDKVYAMETFNDLVDIIAQATEDQRRMKAALMKN